ncbi:MAG TPA: cytidine deaminase [Verrucomicrobiae bacterium]|nr:cytidine deaminase [Verrucomicrobiae bacterium]
MPKADKDRVLVSAALKARQGGVAPYSNFRVGAALLSVSGRIITGANVESASYGLTCCAERVALFGALTQGERVFTAIAVVAATPGGPMPCGACRQLLAEYAPQARVLIADSRQPGRIRRFSTAQLLPKPFVLARIGPARPRPTPKSR